MTSLPRGGVCEFICFEQGDQHGEDGGQRGHVVRRTGVLGPASSGSGVGGVRDLRRGGAPIREPSHFHAAAAAMLGRRPAGWIEPRRCEAVLLGRLMSRLPQPVWENNIIVLVVVVVAVALRSKYSLISGSSTPVKGFRASKSRRRRRPRRGRTRRVRCRIPT